MNRAILFRVQPGTRENPFVKRRLDQRPAVTREFVGEILRIAGTDDSRTGIAAEQPSR
jgi:hypothetical protein